MRWRLRQAHLIAAAALLPARGQGRTFATLLRPVPCGQPNIKWQLNNMAAAHAAPSSAPPCPAPLFFHPPHLLSSSSSAGLSPIRFVARVLTESSAWTRQMTLHVWITSRVEQMDKVGSYESQIKQSSCAPKTHR